MQVRTVRSVVAILAAVALSAAAACSDSGAERRADRDGGPTSTTTTDAPTSDAATTDDATTDDATTDDVDPAEPGALYPGADWERVEPAAAGLDAAGLDVVAQQAEAAGSSCLVVTRDGRVVDERYWGGAGPHTAREAFSVTKSLTSTLVGIAQDAGDLRIGDPVAEHLPEWRGTASEQVTVEDLLSNDSGRRWDLATDYGRMAIREPDKTAFSVGLDQQHPPGAVWAYNNAAIQTLDAVLEEATGQEPADLAREELLAPIGMADSAMTTDAAGNTLTFMGLRTTCLDLARFGYLMLRDGTWDGEEIVSADWVEAATGRSSTELNAAYGYLWWLNRPGRVASPLIATTGQDGGTTEGRLVEGAPEDAFWALGFHSQVVAVLPSEGIVAVRMGEEPPLEAPFGAAELTTGVLASVTG